jgi:hypothetical protein
MHTDTQRLSNTTMQSLYTIVLNKLPGVAEYCANAALNAMARRALSRMIDNWTRVNERRKEVRARMHAVESAKISRMYILYQQHIKSTGVYLKSCSDLCNLAMDQIDQVSLWATLMSIDPFRVYLKASYAMLEKAELSLNLASASSDWIELGSAYMKTASHMMKLRAILQDAKPCGSQRNACEKAVADMYEIRYKLDAWMTRIECHIDQYQKRISAADTNDEADNKDDKPHGIPSREEVAQLIEESDAACVRLETCVSSLAEILAKRKDSTA